MRAPGVVLAPVPVAADEAVPLPERLEERIEKARFLVEVGRGRRERRLVSLERRGGREG